MGKRLLVSILALFFIAGIATAEYTVGDTVQNFTLPDTGNHPVSLYDYADRIGVLFFWNSG